jgi:predicted methyltransferase
MAKKMNKKMTQGMIALAVVLLVVYMLKVRGLVEFKKEKKRVCGRSKELMEKLEPANVSDFNCRSKCREHDVSKCKKDLLKGSCMYKKYVKRGNPAATLMTMPLKQACKIKWV